MKLPKLILSDLDGTLVAEGAGSLPGSLVETLDRLQALGIPFGVSSGRQAASLRRVFAPLARPPLILALNGGALFRGETLLFEEPIPREMALDLARRAAALPEVHVILETARECWVYGADNPLARWLPKRQYHVAVVQRLSQVEGEVIKVACYTERSPEKLERWAMSLPLGQVRAARSGANWVDFNVADKGKGLKALCRTLDIAPADVLAFGDNYNDAPMLEAAGEGMAVEGSLLAGSGQFPVCPGVEALLKKICAEAEKTLAI